MPLDDDELQLTNRNDKYRGAPIMLWPIIGRVQTPGCVPKKTGWVFLVTPT